MDRDIKGVFGSVLILISLIVVTLCITKLSNFSLTSLFPFSFLLFFDTLFGQIGIYTWIVLGISFLIFIFGLKTVFENEGFFTKISLIVIGLILFFLSLICILQIKWQFSIFGIILFVLSLMFIQRGINLNKIPMLNSLYRMIYFILKKVGV